MVFDEIYECILKGLAHKMSLQDIADKHDVNIDILTKQLEMGIQIELEHVKDKDVAETIAMDHLVEHPDYYTKLKKAGL